MQIVTSLSFQGQCREAFEFYATVLGGEITAAMPYGEGPPGMPTPPEIKDWLMHCWLQIGDQAIMGADMAPLCAPSDPATFPSRSDSSPLSPSSPSTKRPASRC